MKALKVVFFWRGGGGNWPLLSKVCLALSNHENLKIQIRTSLTVFILFNWSVSDHENFNQFLKSFPF